MPKGKSYGKASNPKPAKKAAGARKTAAKAPKFPKPPKKKSNDK